MTVIYHPACVAAIEEIMRAWREDCKEPVYADLAALRADAAVFEESMRAKLGEGFVVANAQGDQFRAWEYGPCWTRDLKAALMFARRFDAEEFARDDEDAWKILPVWFDKTTAGLGKRPL